MQRSSLVVAYRPGKSKYFGSSRATKRLDPDPDPVTVLWHSASMSFDVSAMADPPAGLASLALTL
jgi:hypothetical protein